MTIESASKGLKQSGLLKVLTGTAGLLVALAAIILMIVIASALRLKVDLTEHRLYTLSPLTRTTVAQLPRNVTLRLYFSGSSDYASPSLKLYGRRIVDLLKEYEAASNGRISIEVMDPRPGSEAQAAAERLGLASASDPRAPDDSPVYLGLVASSGTQRAAVPVFSPDQEPRLE